MILGRRIHNFRGRHQRADPGSVAYHTFGGSKRSAFGVRRSAFGHTNQHGMEGVKFWTKVKTITQRWPDGSPDGSNAFVIPTMG